MWHSIYYPVDFEYGCRVNRCSPRDNKGKGFRSPSPTTQTLAHPQDMVSVGCLGPTKPPIGSQHAALNLTPAVDVLCLGHAVVTSVDNLPLRLPGTKGFVTVNSKQLWGQSANRTPGCPFLFVLSEPTG